MSADALHESDGDSGSPKNHGAKEPVSPKRIPLRTRGIMPHCVAWHRLRSA